MVTALYSNESFLKILFHLKRRLVMNSIKMQKISIRKLIQSSGPLLDLIWGKGLKKWSFKAVECRFQSQGDFDFRSPKVEFWVKVPEIDRIRDEVPRIIKLVSTWRQCKDLVLFIFSLWYFADKYCLCYVLHLVVPEMKSFPEKRVLSVFFWSHDICSSNPSLKIKVRSQKALVSPEFWNLPKKFIIFNILEWKIFCINTFAFRYYLIEFFNE